VTSVGYFLIKSSSFDEANFSALNETQNMDLTMKTDNRKLKGRKRKGSAPSEWKRNKTKLLRNTGHAYRKFERDTEILEWKIRTPFGATCRLKYFSKFSGQERVDVLKRYWSLGDFNVQRILNLKILMSHETRLESLRRGFRMRK
jgi:hypothetical protein